MQQYPLPLALETDYSHDNFLISGCNETALRHVEAWPAWPSYGLLIYGPAGCGKTHLAHIWAQRSGAVFVDAAQLRHDSTQPLVVDNLERLADETALFHLLNRCKEQNIPLLLCGLHAPKEYGFRLPDMVSRLAALACAHIGAPDDEVLAAALRKQFSDRQLKVPDEVIAYLLTHMPRSFAGAKQLVAELDDTALARKKAITIPMVKSVLAEKFKNGNNY